MACEQQPGGPTDYYGTAVAAGTGWAAAGCMRSVTVGLGPSAGTANSPRFQGRKQAETVIWFFVLTWN